MDVGTLGLGLVAGLLVGALIGYLLAVSRRGRAEESFARLARRALEQNNDQFLALAEQRLFTAQERGAAELDGHRRAFVEHLAPLERRLVELRDAAVAMEKDRKADEGQLGGQVNALRDATADLLRQTTRLETALRGSRHVGGRWGELALRNLVELAGMTEHCDFEEQRSADAGHRPDLTVRIPGGGAVAVDAKAPLADYLAASGAEDDATRAEHLARHADAVRAHVRDLAKRDYAKALGTGVDLVVLFLPTDGHLAAAFGARPELQTEAFRQGVLLASPTTLFALLRTIAVYWKQRSLADNARQIFEQALTLYERTAALAEHLGRVGKGLRASVGAFNQAVGSFERRVLPAGRRLEEMRVAENTKAALRAPEPLAETVRSIATELPAGRTSSGAETEEGT